MRLLVVFVVCCVGVVLSVPRPSFRYAYKIPQPGQAMPWSHFNERSNDHYAWGYEYPGRVHFESKDPQGNVKGSFAYVDAHGNPIVWEYSSDPIKGFQVNTGIGQAQTLPQVYDEGGQEKIYDVDNRNLNIPIKEQVESAVSPLLKSAALAGDILPVGSSLSGTPQYAVDPKIAEEAGGVSALAVRLGAIPVAAVHDVQRRPTFTVSNSAFNPVLVHHEEPEFTLYTLEVPIQ